ncbi:THAP domain-containing protein 11-like [Dreissena polymorpha]|nr:THAP domain-containing protein 11-like [Dreissena polymorpha]
MDGSQKKKRSPRIVGKYKGYKGDYCCVPGCTNSRGSCNRLGLKVAFYQMPSNPERQKLWLQRIRRGEVDGHGRTVPFIPKSHTRICSHHFVGGAKSDDPVDQSYVPSIFPRNSTSKRVTKTSEQAGLCTPSPVPKKGTKRKIDEQDARRSKIPRQLQYPGETGGKAVWETMTTSNRNPLIREKVV